MNGGVRGEVLVRRLEELAGEGVTAAEGPASRWRERLERGQLDYRGVRKLSSIVRRLERGRR